MAGNFSITRLSRQISSSFTGQRYSATNDYDEKRILTINSGPQPTKFISNRISTSKYSLLTFLPKFLFEQFRKYSNIFFLCIVVFQVSTFEQSDRRKRERERDRKERFLANPWCFADRKIYNCGSIDDYFSLCSSQRDH